MLSGYADEHVKSAIVEGLRQRGMDVVTAQERNQCRTDDEALLKTATAEARLLLTNDTDFLRIHAEWNSAQWEHAGIVFWPQELPVGAAISQIVQYALATNPNDAANVVKYLSASHP
jgi:hypothetical protein